MSDTLTKVAHLLRKAETTDNEHEASAFMEAAQRIATLASIDLAVARAHTESRESRVVPIQRHFVVGQAGKKGLGTYVSLYLAIAHANNVKCNIAKNSSYVIAFGFEHDIDTVDALFSSLLMQMVRASDAYIRSGEFKTEQIRKWDEWAGEYVQKPVHGRTARVSFQKAFANRIALRLAVARMGASEEAFAEQQDAPSTGTEIAVRAAELEVASFYKTNSTARGSWKGSSSGSSAQSRQAGSAAADRAKLGADKSIGGSRRAIR